MKKILTLFFTLALAAHVFAGNEALRVDNQSGAINSPVSASTFRGANAIQQHFTDLDTIGANAFFGTLAGSGTDAASFRIAIGALSTSGTAVDTLKFGGLTPSQFASSGTAGLSGTATYAVTSGSSTLSGTAANVSGGYVQKVTSSSAGLTLSGSQGAITIGLVIGGDATLSGTTLTLNTVITGTTVNIGNGNYVVNSKGLVTSATTPTNLQTTNGGLALAGFSGITGTVPNANLVGSGAITINGASTALGASIITSAPGTFMTSSTSGGTITFTVSTGTTSSTVAIGNDTRFPASVSGLRKSAGAGSTDTAAAAADLAGAGGVVSSGTGSTVFDPQMLHTNVKFIGGFFKDVSGTRDNRLFLYDSVDGITFTARNGGNPVVDLSGSIGDVATCRVARYRGEWVIVFETGNYGNVAYWAYVKTKDWVNFTSPVTVSTSAVVGAGEYTWGPHPFVDDDGSFYITFTKANSGQTVQTQYWMKSTDGALASWTTPTQLTVTGGSGNFFRDAQIFKVGPRYYLAYYQGSQNIASGPTAVGPWARCTNETSDMEVCSYVHLPNGNWRLYSELSDTGAGLKYVDLSPDFYGLVDYASATAISPTHLHNGFVVSLEGNEKIERPNTVRDDVYPWPKWNVVRDDFTSYIGSVYGAWGWAASGTITLAGYQPTSGDYYDGILKVSNTANANGSTYAAVNGQRPMALSDSIFEFRVHFRLTSISNVRYGVGLTLGGDSLPDNGVYIDINPGSNANYRAFANGSSVADSGVAADTSWHWISVKCYNGYVGISVETNGVWSTEVWSSSATNFYGAGLPQIIINNTEAVQKAVLMDCFEIGRR